MKILSEKLTETRKHQQYKVSKILPKTYYPLPPILMQFCKRNQGQINYKNKNQKT
jgi:hypothetical protein